MEIQGVFTGSGARLHIIRAKDGVVTNLFGPWRTITALAPGQALLEYAKKHDVAAIETFRTSHDMNDISAPYKREKITTPQPAPKQPEPQTNTDLLKFQTNTVQNVSKFFSEFKFKPAARYINCCSLQENVDAIKDYTNCYMELTDNIDKDAIAQKMKSHEFDAIARDLLRCEPSKQINRRLKIYYGDAGTGKTTKVLKEYPSADVIACNSSMLPDELLRTFDFNDANGNPVFKKSSLRIAMETGKPIIFDELNLLSFDCLRLLQTLTDNKDYIMYNGERISIEDGFEIAATMNLTVNDQVFALPTPLVDRAFLIRRFDLSPQDLASYAF